MDPLHKMRLRVYGKEGSLEIYKQLKGVVFSEYHSFFSLCVFLGYSQQRKSLNKKKREQLFWSDTFSQHEYSAFYSLVVKEAEEENYSLIKDGENVLELLQNYSDEGMDIFLESDQIRPYVKKDGEKRVLDFTSKDHLQKQIMYYVYSFYGKI